MNPTNGPTPQVKETVMTDNTLRKLTPDRATSAKTTTTIGEIKR